MLQQQNNKTTYLSVIIGSRTKLDGRVTRISTKAEYEGKALACVGDRVTYADGSNAMSVDGAGFAAAREDKPFALVGSHLSNGATITERSQDGWGITVRDGETVHGLFESGYRLRPPTCPTGGLMPPDGRTYAGRLHRSGQPPCISTDTSNDYTVHWCDEALGQEDWP